MPWPCHGHLLGHTDDFLCERARILEGMRSEVGTTSEPTKPCFFMLVAKGCYRGLYTDSRFEVCGCLINLWLGTSWLSLKRVLVLMSDGLVSVRIQLDLGNHGIVRHLFTGFGGEKGCEWQWFSLVSRLSQINVLYVMKVIRFQHIRNHQAWLLWILGHPPRKINSL